MTKVSFIVTLLAVLATYAMAWTDEGHTFIAEIATRLMTPKEVDGINSLCASYADYFKNHDITTLPYAATFMDYIKRDTSLFDPMHYVDFPYIRDGNITPPPMPETNAINALTETANSLIYQGNSTYAWSKGFSILLMLHVLGDMHQPLHATTLFSEELKFFPPLGDLGGNFYNITYTSEHGKEIDQIHLFYDCIGGQFCNYMPHPVTHSYADMISAEADKIMEMFPKEDLIADGYIIDPIMETTKDFKKVMTQWAQESYQLAIDSYEAIPMDRKNPVSEMNVQWARSMLKKRVALAGYRTAHILKMVDTSINNYEVGAVSSSWRIATIICIMLLAVSLIAIIILFRRYKTASQNLIIGDNYGALNG